MASQPAHTAAHVLCEAHSLQCHHCPVTEGKAVQDKTRITPVPARQAGMVSELLTVMSRLQQAKSSAATKALLAAGFEIWQSLLRVLWTVRNNA